MDTETIAVAPVEVSAEQKKDGEKPMNGLSHLLNGAPNEEDLTPPSVNGHHSPTIAKKAPLEITPEIIEVQPTIE
jgi:hypothetical protein